MRRQKSILFIFALLLAASLLIACGASSEEPAAPTATLEPPPSPTPVPEIEIPSTSSEVPRMTVDELKERLDDGAETVIVDTRSEAQYDAAHITGALWVPSVLLESPLDDLQQDHEIVLYCA